MADTVVVGFIRSAEGQAALAAAVAESRLRNATLVVVHSAKGGGHEHADEVIAEREALESAVSALRADGLEVQVRDLVRGQEPADDLIDVADTEGASLIVIGLRRRSAVGKLIMGSNSQRILLEANCPVLAVKAE